MLLLCQSCGMQLKIEEEDRGTTIKCQECRNVIHVPRAGVKITKDMIISGYKMVKRLGIGGMGEVWLAEQTAMDRKVALKILSPDFTHDSDFVNRFMAEAKFSAKLEHKHLVTAFDAGVDNNIHYLAISYIEGEQLESLLFKKEFIKEDTALKYIKNIAEALEYTWKEHQILHRDVKPANIMIDQKNEAKLMDMGLCKSLTEDLNLTKTDIILGTPYYMSPEQALDGNIDFKSDIYSLGATYYHILTGVKPYNDRSPAAVINKHANYPIPDPKVINPNISDASVELIKIMMAKKPKDRQKSWGDVIHDITMVESESMPDSLSQRKHDPFGTKAEDSEKDNNTIKKDKKSHALAIVIVMFVVILALITWYFIFVMNKVIDNTL